MHCDGVHMTDSKALFTQRFDAARAALAQGDDPAAAEAFHWAIVIARGDSNLRRELASGLFHLGKLSRKFGRAGESEAEELLSEALAISEGLFGPVHSALVPVLSELSRLRVQRSQHARAEETLGRLLTIVRSKGEENADVANALAGLAVVKRKLGDDASAEPLYRDALHIREKALGSAHMITVGTLEQLSETCAALGKSAEALTLLQRALAAREASLGPGHETVRVARSRLAELELQVAIAADAAAVAAARASRGAMRTPAWFKAAPMPAPESTPADAPLRIDSKELEFLGDPEPPLLRPASPLERAKTPAVAAAVAAASMIAAPMKTPAAPSRAISPQESVRPTEIVSGRQSGATRRDFAVADFTFGSATPHDAVVASGEASVAVAPADSAEPVTKPRRVLYGFAGLAAAVIAIAALMLRPRGDTRDNVLPTQRVVAPGALAAPTTGSLASGAAAVVAASRVDSERASNAAPVTTTAPTTQASSRVTQNLVPEIHPPRIEVNIGAIPGMPTASDIDSLVRSAPARARVVDAEKPAASATENAPQGSPDPEDAPTPPKMIGRPPVPRFPDALLRSVRTDGQVVVRFRVTEVGAVDVGSMVVVRSDHPLFTAAVRDILPDFRFEPARTHAPDSKPVAAWVSVPFRFSAKR